MALAAGNPGQARAVDDLLEESAIGPAELVTLSAVELCTLGRVRHLLADEIVTRTWAAADDRARAAMMELSAQSLLRRGLLIANGAPEMPVIMHKYPVSPELGIVLAAKTQPTVAVLCSLDGRLGRFPKMYVVGDAEQPARGVVVELPARYPQAQFPGVRKLGALGALYKYVLVSPEKAADMLAQWAIAPPPEASDARTVSIFCHHKDQQMRINVIKIVGDGEHARLAGHRPDDPGAVMGLPRLRGLLAIHLRQAQS